MKIKKNDKVILNQPHSLPYRKDPLPAGTKLMVWKAQRDGTLACSCDSFSVRVKASDVTLVPRNVTMPKIGDLFYSSWGYDQTNIDFYQVTGVKGKMIEATQIAGQSSYDQPMAGHTKPVPNKFTGESKRYLVRFNADDQPYFKVASYAYAWPTTADQSHFFSEWH